MNIQFEKLRWAYKLMRSRTFVILTDTSSAISLPLVNFDSFDNQYILAGQSASLKEFSERIQQLITEHDDAIKLLSYRGKKK